MKNLILSCTLFISFVLTYNIKAQTTSPYIGQISYVAFMKVPVNWHECDGTVMSISQNVALFSLIGNTYGGNGTTTFALPDMRGRIIVSNGSVVGSTNNYQVGQTGGVEMATLQTSQIPSHSHTVNATTTEGNLNNPNGGILANTKTLDKEYNNATPNTTMNSSMIGTTGSNQPHENRQPYVVLKCIISLAGDFPAQ